MCTTAQYTMHSTMSLMMPTTLHNVAYTISSVRQGCSVSKMISQHKDAAVLSLRLEEEHQDNVRPTALGVISTAHETS